MTENLPIEEYELQAVGALTGFDLVMILSEIHEHGWFTARETLKEIPAAKKVLEQAGPKGGDAE